MTTISQIFLTVWLGVQSFFGFNHEPAVQPPQVTFGEFNPTGGKTYRLQSSITSTQTNITLSSFKEPVSNIPYTMSYLNSDIMFGTINPQNNNSKEFVSFTGITQNSDGTATLTGVTRGLGFSYPYTASTTLAQAHSGQSIFILSNPPQLYGKYANKSNPETITGLWTYNTVLPTSSLVATTSVQFVTKALLDATSFQGVATSTESAGGIVELGTLAEQASSFDGGVSKPTVLQTKNSTSTCQVVGSYNIVASTTTGKMDKGCFDQTAMYNFTGARNNFQNASSTGISAGYLYIGGTATSSISSTGVLTLGTTTAGVLQTSTSGIVYAGSAPRFTYASTSAGASVTNGYATSTANFVVPALNASSTIHFKGNFTCDNSANGDRDCTVFLKDSTGATLTTITVTSDAASALTYAFDVMVSREAGTSNWANIGSAVNYGPFFNVSTIGGVAVNNTSSLSLSSGATFQVVVRSAGTLTTATLTNYSIIVNP